MTRLDNALVRMVEDHGTTLTRLAEKAVTYFQSCQLADGSLAEQPRTHVFAQWDSINALKAMALWRDRMRSTGIETTIESIHQYLRSCEKPSGMLSWGAIETGPAEYCTETSSEYISALTLLDRFSEARPKAEFLRSQQARSGEWKEVHPHIPAAFQSEPSVTGFALMALRGIDVDPLYLDESVRFLAGAQKSSGHFGINWYYYNTYYYLMRPAVAALNSFGHYAAVRSARDFVLSQQRADGSWYDEVADFGEASSAEQHTALALGTLAEAGTRAEHLQVGRGLRWLLGRQRDDGSWFGGPYPYPRVDAYGDFHATQDVYTTAQVLSVLHRFIKGAA